MRSTVGGDDPMRPQFWFLMSIALIVGFGCAYPINWWLVANQMKHGMMTIRPKPAAAATKGHSMDAMSHEMSAGSGSGQHQPSAGVKAAMTVLTFAILGVALVIVVRFAM
jgi:hypothetical protein